MVNRYEIPGMDHPLFRKIQVQTTARSRPCLTSCFVNAYTKTPEGAVVYNADVCVGCRTCMIACPFYIPTFRYSSAFHPRIMKCIFCYDTRLSKGKPPGMRRSLPAGGPDPSAAARMSLEMGRQRHPRKSGHLC